MKSFSAALLIVGIVLVQTAFSKDLTILTENLPPLNFIKDGRLVGPSVDIAEEIKNRVGCQAPIQVYPWARAYQIALEDENVVLFSTAFTEVRKNKFKWVGPLATKRDILVAKKNAGIKIATLDDAKKVRSIGTLRGDTKERFLLDHGFTNLEPVSDEKLNAQKLMLGRIDLWVYKIPGLRTVCELAGVNYNDLKEVYNLRKSDLCIAFSIKTSDSIVEKWREAFEEMSRDGTLMKIKKKWNAILEDAPFPEIEK
jgi:polar amino acid transport system substrate-binding protein